MSSTTTSTLRLSATASSLRRPGNPLPSVAPPRDASAFAGGVGNGANGSSHEILSLNPGACPLSSSCLSHLHASISTFSP